MNLFELFAKLSLDVTDFDQGVQDAIDKSGDIQKAVEGIDTSSVDDEIGKLNREISDLDADIKDKDALIKKTNEEIAALEGSIKVADQKAAATQGIIQGLTSAAVDLAKEALKAVIQFCGESLEYVAASGTEAGNKLKDSMDNMDLTMEALKMKVGTALAPVASSFYDLAAALTGVSEAEKIDILLRKLDSYQFEKINQVKKDLDGIFKDFEKYKPPEADKWLSATDLIAGLQNQAIYFAEYDRIVKSLQEKGVSTDILAQYADGSTESYNQLRAMEKASAEEITALNEAYAKLEANKKGAAETIADAQMQVDEKVQDLVDSIARLATDINTSMAGDAVGEIGENIVSSLMQYYPSISKWVNTINAKIGSIGNVGVNTGGVDVISSPTILELTGGQYGIGTPRATGMDYVPYNNYLARLHEGEAVLTKAEATLWRRGEGAGGYVGIDYGQLGQAMAGALSGMSVQMDGQAVGVLVTGAVSREMGRRVKGRQYTG